MKTLVQAKHLIEDKRSDHGSGLKAILAENLGKGDVRVMQLVVFIAVDVVIEGGGPGKHGAVGRQRLRNRRNRMIEQRTSPGDRIYVGGGVA